MAVVLLRTEANLESRLMFSYGVRWILPALPSVNMCMKGLVPMWTVQAAVVKRGFHANAL